MSDIIRQPRLITLEYLKAYSPIPNNFNMEEIENFIGLAETIHILPVLSQPLYDEMLEQVQSNTLTDVNSTLILKIYGLEGVAVTYEALPFIHTKISEIGLVTQSADNAQSVDMKGIRYIDEKLAAMVDYKKKELIEFLNEYAEFYPLFTNSKYCNCNKPNLNFINKIYTNKKFTKNINIE